VAAPSVSIICIFLDMEAFIAEAIKSVLDQDFEDFELLLVDDGSTDGSTSIARDFERRFPDKVRYLEHEGHANRGMSASRNLGIQCSTAPYLAFIDADDRWRPTKLSQQITILDREPEAAMVCGRVNYWETWRGGRDRLVFTGHRRDGLSRPPETLLSLYPLGVVDAPCPSDIMVRRSAVEAVGGFEESFTGFYEDMAFFVKIFAEFPVWLSTSVWLDYRRHEGSASSNITADDYRRIRRSLLDRLEVYVANRPISEKARVLRAIATARWELDHAFLGRLRRSVRSRLARLSGGW
jgi:glycosyltransferase involved in cell wall biosynthesis